MSPTPLAKGAVAGSGAKRRGPVRYATWAWLSAAAALGLSLLGVHAIDVAGGRTPHALADLGPMALRQVIFLGIGVGAGIAAAIPHFRWFGRMSWVMYAGCVGCLVFLVMPGVPEWLVTPRNGARSWINLRIFDFQPSEPTKVAFVLTVAQFLRYRTTHRRLWGLVPPGLIAFVPVGLIMLQPDLGTAILFVPALFAMLVAAGARLRHMAIIVAAASLAAPAAYPLLRPHQKERIAGLLRQVRGDRSADQDINFQSATARVLAGAGGATGQGEARSRAMIAFNRLPERHNDMVFAVIVNRFGLAGGVAVLGLSMLWIVGAWLTAALSREPLARLLLVGLGAFIAAQVVINVGMNLGLVPIIGITLPFVSYGGSSLVTVWIMTGLVVNVGIRRPPRMARPSLEYADDDE